MIFDDFHFYLFILKRMPLMLMLEVYGGVNGLVVSKVL